MEEVQLQYALLASDGRTPLGEANAVELDVLMQRWLIYGVYQGCSRAVSGIVGTLTCIVSVSQCVRAPFRQWLIEQLPTHQGSIGATQGAVLMSVPLVRIMSATHTTARRNTSRPYNAPKLAIHPREWGQSHLETLLTLGACAATIGGLCVGAAAAFALACLRWRRRVEWSDAWEHIAASHARKLRA